MPEMELDITKFPHAFCATSMAVMNTRARKQTPAVDQLIALLVRGFHS